MNSPIWIFSYKQYISLPDKNKISNIMISLPVLAPATVYTNLFWQTLFWRLYLAIIFYMNRISSSSFYLSSLFQTIFKIWYYEKILMIIVPRLPYQSAWHDIIICSGIITSHMTKIENKKDIQHHNFLLTSFYLNAEITICLC